MTTVMQGLPKGKGGRLGLVVGLTSVGVWGDLRVGVMCTVVAALVLGHLFNSKTSSSSRTSSSSSNSNNSGTTTTAAATTTTTATTTLVAVVVVVVGCVVVEVGALRATLGVEGVGLIIPALEATLH
jgi:hypothetical protein